MDNQTTQPILIQTVVQVLQVPVPKVRFSFAILTHSGFDPNRVYQDFWVVINGEVVAAFIHMVHTQPPSVTVQDVVDHVRRVCGQHFVMPFDYGTLNVTQMLQCAAPGVTPSVSMGGWQADEVQRIAQTFFGMKSPDLAEALDALGAGPRKRHSLN